MQFFKIHTDLAFKLWTRLREIARVARPDRDAINMQFRIEHTQHKGQMCIVILHLLQIMDMECSQTQQIASPFCHHDYLDSIKFRVLVPRFATFSPFSFPLELLRFQPWIQLRSQISTLFGTCGNSDSRSGSRKKWICNSYRGVIILSLDLDPELDS